MRPSLGSPVIRSIVVGVLLSMCEATAYAQVTENAARADGTSLPPRVTIKLVGDAGEAAALEERVLSWFRQQGTITESSRQSTLDPQAVFSPQEPGVQIWIVLQLPASVRLLFAVQDEEQNAPRYLVRDVALDGGLDEIGLEQVAQVVNLSTMALWAGNLGGSRQEVETELGVQSPPTTTTTPTPTTTTTTTTPLEHTPTEPFDAGTSREKSRPDERGPLAVGFEYAARWAGPEGVLQGPGATLGVLFLRPSFELGARLHAQLFLPREVEHSGVTLRLRGATFGLGGSLAQPMSERVSVTSELGAGLDLIEYGVISVSDPSLEASGNSFEVRPLAYASLGVRGDLGPVRLGGAALLAVQMLRTHYDISEGDERSELFAPWMVQPGLVADVTW
jgi:hypothetical protein